MYRIVSNAEIACRSQNHRRSIRLSHGSRLTASGPIGIYGIVEKVVFEPNERSPERIQVWGAFAYVDGGANSGLAVSAVKRGYLYFRLPLPGVANARDIDAVKKEWADLKAVAGTGQAIGFGSWGYIGSFAGLQPQARSSMPPYILERAPGGGAQTDLQVRARVGSARRARHLSNRNRDRQAYSTSVAMRPS